MGKYTKGQKKLSNIKKQKQKYPELLNKIMNISDIFLQVLDARFIQETRNLKFEESAKKNNKTIIYILNKADLINQNKIKKAQLKKLYPYVFISSKKRQGSQKLRDLIKREADKINKKEALAIRQGKVKQPHHTKIISVGVIGYPNTGKSTLINFLIGKSSAKTGSDAGFTKSIQRLRLTSDIALLDMPGVIPSEKYSNTKVEALAHHTKVGGRSYSQVKDPETIIAMIIKEHPGVFEKFYKINAKGDSEVLIEELGKRKSLFKKKGKVDFDKASRIILKDWQTGKIKINFI